MPKAPSLVLMLAAAAVLAPLSRAGAQPVADDLGGRLVAEIGGRTVAFPLLRTELDADLQGDLAAVTVVQRFENPGDRPLNAVYQFPLPEKAAVHAMVMAIGEERVEARIQEREQARRTYEAARQEGRNAALLTQHRPNVFTQEVANLMPGVPVTVTLRYVQTVPRLDGAYELAMPLVVGPRYEKPPVPAEAQPPATPGAWSFEPMPAYPAVAVLTIPKLVEEDRVAIRLRLHAGMPIASAASPTHALAREDSAPGEALFRLAAGRTIDNRDFVFRYALAGQRTQAGFLARRDERGTFFSLLVEPPAIPAADEVAPREMVFLLDCSGSMSGLPIEASKNFMRRALGALRPTDSFRIIRFSDSATAFGERPMPATPDNVRRGLAYTDSLQGEGGTNMSAGIAQALKGRPPAGSRRLVVFLTDGYIGAEAEVLGLVRRQIGDARLYAFGVGAGVNRFLMAELGRVGRGFTRLMDPTEDVDAVAARLVERLQSPVLTDVTIDWGATTPADAAPARLPDLFAGDSLRIQGRFDGAPPARATIRGLVNGRPAALPVDLTVDPSAAGGEALPILWARSRIEDAMGVLTTPADLREGGQTDDALRERVTRLGLDFSLTTQWTSFVAVSDGIANPAPLDAASRSVPLPMVAGVGPSAYSGSSTPEPELGLVLVLLLALMLWLRRPVTA